MKALYYFLLFYACIFLISMIPEENVAEINETSSEVLRQSNNKETSYNVHADSIQKWRVTEVY